MILCRIVGYRPMLCATNKDEQRTRVLAHGTPVATAPTTQYWGPVDNSEHVFFSSYGMAPASRQPLYYRLPHGPHGPHGPQDAHFAASADRAGFSMLHPSRVHPHSPFVYPYPYAFPYPYPYHHHHIHGGHPGHPGDSHAAAAVDQLSQTWPPRMGAGAAPGAEERVPPPPYSTGPGAAPSAAPAPPLPRVLSSPTNRKGRRILDPLPYPAGSAPLQSRNIVTAGGNDAEQRHKMPPLAATNGGDHHHHNHLQNGSVERIVLADDASSRATAVVVSSNNSNSSGSSRLQRRTTSSRPGGLPAPRANALGAGEPTPPAAPLPAANNAPDPQDAANNSSPSEPHISVHAPPQRPVLARPSNSPPTQSASSISTNHAVDHNSQSSSSTARGSHHPLAPVEVEDTEDTSPRNDSASSSRTSANAAGSTISLQNSSNSSAPASGQASGGTSGYHSTAVSPGTDHGQTNNHVADADTTLSNDSSGDGDARADGEDGVDGESHPVVVQVLQDAYSSPNHDRFIEDNHIHGVAPAVRRLDVSPPPKRQSAAARRARRGVRVPLNRPRATTPGSLGSSAGSASLMSLANGSLNSSLGNSTASLFADTLPGFENPREALNRGLQQLEANEWEVTMQALQTIVRLLRHHPAIIQGQLHTCCESLARQVRNLRSQVARAACQVASHLFQSLKRGMDAEAEDLSTSLFNRTADTNKFLRADANSALDAMADNITPAKAVSAIVHKGCRHQNAIVRAAGARILARLVDKLGVEKTMSQPRETRDLMLLTSARLLMEGSLETRSHTKSLLKNLAQDHRLSSILVEIVPSNVMRSIDKTLKSCILRK